MTAGHSYRRDRADSVLDAAYDYLRRRWEPVPLPPGEKAPRKQNWQTLTITESNIEQHFTASSNIGVRLGRASGGLTDVDFDCPEAVALADVLLPPTGAVFGRRSAPRSHRLYITDLSETARRAAIRYQEPQSLGGAVLVELRTGGGGKGAQTMFPPSRHPSGESVRWDEDGRPERIDGAILARCVAAVAAGALLARHYPSEGSRHDAALVLGGLLARVPGMDGDDIQRFVSAVARAAGDEEAEERGRTAAGAVAVMARGDPTPGLPRMREMWGAEITDCVAKWFDIPAGKRPLSQDERVNARIAELAQLSGIDYDRKREEVAKELGIRKSTLDKAVEEQRDAQSRKAAAPPPPDLGKLAALSAEIIECTDVLSLFAETFGKLIAGETKNAKILYLAGTSRLFDRPMDLAFKGPSAKRRCSTCLMGLNIRFCRWARRRPAGKLSFRIISCAS
jgi:hypothetical protein